MRRGRSRPAGAWAEARDGINGVLKGFGWAANPADVTGFANSESFPQIMEHMINDPRMGTLVVASAGADAQAQQVISQRDRTDKGVVFLWTGSRDAKAGLAQLKHARIPIFYTPDKLARGLQSRLAYHTWRERRLAEALPRPRRAPHPGSGRRPGSWSGASDLSESESKELLAAWGVASARERRANSAEAAVAAAEQLGFPVALKVDSPDIPHKTEAGVVRLNLRDAAQVRTAYAEILASAKAICGSTGSDHRRVGAGDGRRRYRSHHRRVLRPAIGPGAAVRQWRRDGQVYNDVALRRCPITRSEAQAMIAEVKGARLLQGFRGRPAADLEALEDTLVRVSHLAMHLEGHLAELDINPLMVLPSGQGVKAVDALVVFRGK